MAQDDGIVKELNRIASQRNDLIERNEALQDRIEALEEQVGTAYQIVGCLADFADVYEHPAVIRAMDYLAYGKTDDGTDILPWPRPALNHKD